MFANVLNKFAGLGCVINLIWCIGIIGNSEVDNTVLDTKSLIRVSIAFFVCFAIWFISGGCENIGKKKKGRKF